MRKFQENRVRNGEVIRVLDRHTARHLFRSSHLKISSFSGNVYVFLK